MEERWALTAASAGQRLGAVALGVANLVGVGALTSMLSSPANQLALVRAGMAWVGAAMPYLQAYALAFFLVPALRSLQVAAANRGVEARNAQRSAALRLLAAPDAALRAKLAAAEAAATAELRVVGTGPDVLYRSDAPLDEQPRDMQADDWEARLERRSREKQQQPLRGGKTQGRQPPSQQEQQQRPLWWQQQQQQLQEQRDRERP